MMVIIPCIAEIAVSDTPERVKKLRLGAVSELQRYLHYYRQLGYMPKLLYAIADKKCRMICEHVGQRPDDAARPYGFVSVGKFHAAFQVVLQ